MMAAKISKLGLAQTLVVRKIVSKPDQCVTHAYSQTIRKHYKHIILLVAEYSLLKKNYSLNFIQLFDLSS